MDFQRFLDGIELYRIQFRVILRDENNTKFRSVNLIVDTGNTNTIVSQNLADLFSIEKLADDLQLRLGGYKHYAERHILPCIEFEHDFIIRNVAVESIKFEPDYELYNSILLGLNTLNNWDYKISNKDKMFSATERLSVLVPNRVHHYKNYFQKVVKNGKVSLEYSRLMTEEPDDDI
jgi:hypothetical protein